MSDYIKREEAKQYFCDDCRKTTYEKCEYKDTCASIRVLNRVASADVVERKRGEWIDRSEGGRIKYPWWESCECNKCGEYGSGAYNYCPNCGAKMKGAEK